MKPRLIISLTLLMLIGLNLYACSTMSDKSDGVAMPEPAPVRSAPIMHDTSHEGGIVGTGNQQECDKQDNKENCNDNVK